MAFLGKEYNAADMPQSEGGFDPIPDGWYDVTIVKADLKATQKGGEMLNIRYDVTGPTHQGRVLFGGLNIRNANPTAEKIGLQQFGELMAACGLARVKDTDELIGRRLAVKVRTQPARDGYDARNEIKGFRALEGSQMPKPSAPAPTVAAGTGPTPPWIKK